MMITRDLDPAFQGAGQKAGLEIWRIERFNPVPVPNSSYGKFYTGDSYIVLKTTASKSGTLHHDIHYWLGKDTSQDEAGTAAIKTFELDAVLGGHAVQYREIQGHETENFLSYFRPCIIPQPGGVSTGFKHAEGRESVHVKRLYVCKGKHVVRVKEVPFARSSLSHDDVFILDTKSKIFQFNGSNSSIQERAKVLEVVQYIKDTFHNGKCEVAAVEDGRLMADADAGEFWALFGGFAPLPKKTSEDKIEEAFDIKLFRVEKGKTVPTEVESLTRELLESNKCYLLDCGIEIFIWIGKSTNLEDRKSACAVAEDLVRGVNRAKAHVIRVMEGFETVMFRSKFDSWPQTAMAAVSEDGRGKVAALLKLQGLDVKGLVKSDPVKEEPDPYIDCSGNLQVWRVNGQENVLLSASDQSKLYTGDCYVFQYAYLGVDGEEYLIGTWLGRKSTEDDRTTANLSANRMVMSLKSQAVQARIYEGKEPPQFCAIFQSFTVFKGGLSSGYKNYIAENNIVDDTYTEHGTALFRVQGSGPDNMQAIQVDTVGSFLNSSYCFILHSGDNLYTWSGSLSTSEDQDLLERQLDVIKPDLQYKPLKDGAETEQFWDLLGGKMERSNKKIATESESDPHLFCCFFSEGTLKVNEVFNFTQDDIMTEDVFILDCHSSIFIWVGQQVDSKKKSEALNIGEEFLKLDVLLENLSRETPIFIISEGSEPQFFTRFFSWDSSKSAMHGNSYQRKLAFVKHGVAPVLAHEHPGKRLEANYGCLKAHVFSCKPKRRAPIYSGRSVLPEKSRSRSASFSPDKARSRGRSPAFNALASTFENPNARNLSMPPAVGKLYPKSSLGNVKVAPRSAAIAALTTSFESSRGSLASDLSKVSFVVQRATTDSADKHSPLSSRVNNLTINEDAKEQEIENEGLPTFPYDRLTTSSADPVTEIDVTKREAYLSSMEFKEKFNMTKAAFYKLPKWKQNKLKMAVHLF